MSKCNLCGGEVLYRGLVKIECGTHGCGNYRGPSTEQKNPASVVSTLSSYFREVYTGTEPTEAGRAVLTSRIPFVLQHGVGREITVGSWLSYGAAMRAVESKDQFRRETEIAVRISHDIVLENLEIGMLYGQSPLAEVGLTSCYEGTFTFVVRPSSWAPGLWVGASGRSLDLFCSLDALSPFNKRPVIVSLVNHSTRTVTCLFDEEDSDIPWRIGTSAVVTRRGARGFFYEDEYYARDAEMAGIDRILSESTPYDCGGPLTLHHISKGLSELSVAAGSLGNMTVVMSSSASLLGDAFRCEKNDLGNLVVATPVGMVELLPHPMCKEGEAFAVPLGVFARVGPTDITYRLPVQCGNNAGYEFRAYTDQELACYAPHRCMKFIVGL